MLEKENGSCDESVSSTLSTNETHCEKDELRKSSLE